MSAPVTCPLCGSQSFTIDEHAEVGVVVMPAFYIVGRVELQERTRPAIVAFCNECEFCIEVKS